VPAVIALAIELEAVFVFVLIVVTAPLIVPAVLAVPAVIAEAIDELAVFVFVLIDDIAPVTSEATARAPESRLASVSLLVAYDQTSAAVRAPPADDTAASKLSTICLPTVPAPFNVDVATVHTSAARVPNDVSVLPEFAHTAVGIVARSDVLAVNTVAFVLAFIVDIALATCEFVFALITEARDVLAVSNEAFVFELTEVVPAVIADAIEVLAVVIVPAVLAVPAVIALAIEVEAVPIVLAVLAVPAVIAAAIDELAEFVLALTADVIPEV
jgi:hypothetical protein